MTYCEDYPCCGHTNNDPCDPRSMVDEPWYCDECGFNHAGYMVQCPVYDEDDEDYDDTDAEDVAQAIHDENEARLYQMEYELGIEPAGWQDSY